MFGKGDKPYDGLCKCLLGWRADMRAGTDSDGKNEDDARAMKKFLDGKGISYEEL